MKKIYFFTLALMALPIHAAIDQSNSDIRAKQRMNTISENVSFPKMNAKGMKAINAHMGTPCGVTPPDGIEPQVYEMNGYISNWGEITATYSIIQNVIVDGNDYYFNNLIPDFAGVWIKGTREGDVISIKKQSIAYIDEYGDTMYPTCTCQTANYEGDGIFTASDEDYKLIFKGDTIESLNHDNFIGIYFDCEDDTSLSGIMSVAGYIDMWPSTMKLLSLPEGAQPDDRHIFMTEYSFDASYLTPCKYYEAGNEVYIQGICASYPDSWVKGTKEGDTITIPSLQYVGDYIDLYFATFSALTLDHIDEYDWAYFNACDYLKLTVKGDTLVSGMDQIFGTGIPFGEIIETFKDAKIMTVDNTVETTPTDPYGFTAEVFNPDWGNAYYRFHADFKGVNGCYLNPEQMAYQVFMDNQLYEFPAEFYAADFEEGLNSTTDVPFNYNGYNFYPFGNFHSFVYYEDMFEVMGVRSVYTVGDKKFYSNIVNWNPVTGEISTYTSIEALKQDKEQSTAIYSLDGRQLDKLQKGINLVRDENGNVKKILK